MSTSKKSAVCIVSCSVLRKEFERLKREGKLDAELVFVSKNFHVDYAQLESNLRKILDQTKGQFGGKIVLVYGDLCLGQNGEMKKLANQYGVSKVDALNCIDCQMGGKGRAKIADPDHNLMFLGPGMIEFFRDMRINLKRHGMDDVAFAGIFSGMKGIVILDTLGNTEQLVEAVKQSGMNLPVIETRHVGCQGILDTVHRAAKRSPHRG